MKPEGFEQYAQVRKADQMMTDEEKGMTEERKKEYTSHNGLSFAEAPSLHAFKDLSFEEAKELIRESLRYTNVSSSFSFHRRNNDPEILEVALASGIFKPEELLPELVKERTGLTMDELKDKPELVAKVLADATALVASLVSMHLGKSQALWKSKQEISGDEPYDITLHKTNEGDILEEWQNPQLGFHNIKAKERYFVATDKVGAKEELRKKYPDITDEFLEEGVDLIFKDKSDTLNQEETWVAHKRVREIFGSYDPYSLIG